MSKENSQMRIPFFCVLCATPILGCAPGFNPDLTDFGEDGETATDGGDSTEGEDGTDSGDATDGESDSDSTDGGQMCGDGAVDAGEECDTTNFGGNTCADLGFAGGTLLCDESCAFDTSNCDQCGNGQIDPGESCDGEDLGDVSTCEDLEIGLASEFLSCDESCNWDLSECSGCGDGTIAGPEECEPGPPELLDGATCESEGFDSGSLACTVGCGFDVSDCATCGDGLVGGNESCDGDNLAGKTCQTIGYTSGDLNCAVGCTIDASSCEGFQFERQVRSVASSEAFSCATVADGVKCWGVGNVTGTGMIYPDVVGDEPNEMGNNLPPIDLGVQASVLGLDAGSGHVCALFEDGSAKCWGSGNKGQLGQGNTEAPGLFPGEVAVLPPIDLEASAVDISTGAYFTCALLADQSVKCWGENARGQLGQGDQIVRGDNPGEMGVNLPAVDLGAGVVVVGIVTGTEHACAMLDDGSLKCWGANDFGQLGLGHQNDLGDGPGEMGDNLAEISFGDGLTVLAIGAGQFHTCAILSDAGVRCWGRGTALGQGNALDISDPEGLPAVDLNGAVPVSLQCGNSLTCAVLDDGKVKCWGINGDGQLGQGNTEAKGDEPNEMGNLPPIDLGAGVGVYEVATGTGPGTAHVCARLDTDGVKCWGYNGLGQLGQGDTENRGDNFGDMGDNLPEINL